jgi:SAM-dependent methyltransferase
MRSPHPYWQFNTAGTLALLRAMPVAPVNLMVFSSACVLYGVAGSTPVDEEHSCSRRSDPVQAIMIRLSDYMGRSSTVASRYLWPKAVAKLIRALINGQIRLSRTFDLLLADRYRIDGWHDFTQNVVPGHLREKTAVYDVGGGSLPYLDHSTKQEYNLRVVGLDIDAVELASAPPGIYDERICADITSYQGKENADLVICRCVLEHVSNVEKALSAIGRIMRPGGKVLIFTPSRNAWFARINLIMPEPLRCKILFFLYPEAADGHSGFPPVYHNCTPKQFRRAADDAGLEVETTKLYFASEYFSFFFPLHVAWRLWLMAFRLLAGEQAAEMFAMVLAKPFAEEAAEPSYQSGGGRQLRMPNVQPLPYVDAEEVEAVETVLRSERFADHVGTPS